MIQINLLPVKGSRRRESGRQQLVLVAAVLVAILGANLVWYLAVDRQLSAVSEKLARVQEDTRKIEARIGEVKSIKQDTQALQKKLDALESLKKARTGPVKVLDELATVIPPRTWLKTYAEKGGEVLLTGNAVTYEDLSTFSKNLKAAKHFKNVTIRKASQRPDGVVDWEIACNADYSA